MKDDIDYIPTINILFTKALHMLDPNEPWFTQVTTPRLTPYS